MGTYYNDVKDVTGFTKKSLSDEICKVFGLGLAALVQTGEDSDLDKARHGCVLEVFAHMVTYSFPNLDELKSMGPLQTYVKLSLESRK